MMRIRRVKDGVVIGCRFCDKPKKQAVWHLTGENIQACDEHKTDLTTIMDTHNRIQSVLDSKEPSEADQQTWMRL
jgi:hypothetical protein